MTRLRLPNKNYRRWLQPLQGYGIAATSQTPTAGRVLLMLFEVNNPCYVDAVVYQVAGTSAGNVTAGLYRPVTEDTAEGATVVVQSSSTAQGSINTPQTVTFTSTYLAPGRYYTALEFSDATATYLRHTNASQITGWAQFYDRSGGYGALTDPCPSVTSSGSVMPGVRVRVVQ
jgi:hypothetical protein